MGRKVIAGTFHDKWYPISIPKETSFETLRLDLAGLGIYVKGNVGDRTFPKRKRFLYRMKISWFIAPDDGTLSIAYDFVHDNDLYIATALEMCVFLKRYHAILGNARYVSLEKSTNKTLGLCDSYISKSEEYTGRVVELGLAKERLPTSTRCLICRGIGSKSFNI